MSAHNKYEESILQNRFLLENIQGGIVFSDFDPPFHLRYCTEGMAKLTGYTADELLELTQVDIVMEEDLPALVEDVNRQFACGDTFEVEYRLKRKDGSSLYVLDRAKAVQHDDGKKYIHCLLTDISELKEMERALRLNQEKYRIAIEQSNKAVLECNIQTGRIIFSENYEHLFGCAPPVGTLQDILNGSWVVSEYTDNLMTLIDTVSKKAITCSMEMQIHVFPQKTLWCSLYLIPVMDQGQMYSIIGCLENIDEKKKQIQHLTELTERDSLTGVYNRYAIENFACREMKNQSKEAPITALLIFDVDCFKQINDKNGHDFGDKVLIELSQTVKELVPKNAFLGRVGGDEFLVFVMQEKDTKVLESLASRIVCGVRQKFANCAMQVTVSVGVSLTSICGDSFQSLYRNADKALYQAKENGKDGYAIFAYPTDVSSDSSQDKTNHLLTK
ncbi:MAG: diguanylate cyclase [Anaerocolumna sp.]